MEITLKLPKPHSAKQRTIMRAFHLDGVSEIWVACGTKFGKSIAASASFTSVAPLKPQALYRWIAPIYSQAMIGYKYVEKMAPPAPYTDCKPGNPSIHFPHNDTTIQFFHGQHPESIEGVGTAGNIIDEAAKTKEAVYAAVKTTTTVTRGPIMPISTPFGKNYFYYNCMKAKEEMEWAFKKGITPKKIFIHAPSTDNPLVLPETIEEAKRSLPERLFRQYFLAEFVDDGSVFQYLHDAFGGSMSFNMDDTFYLPSHESTAIAVGADWAKKHDYTVFTAINEKGIEIGHKRLSRITYPDQVQALRAFCDEVGRNSTLANPHISVLHDKTGVGEAIDDIISSSNFPYDINGILWNNTNKESFVNDLILSFEERCLHLNPWQVAKDELNSFEVHITKNGRATYSAPDGLSDDYVMSLVLSNSLYRSNRGRTTSVAVVDTLNNLVRRIHYNGGVLDD